MEKNKDFRLESFLDVKEPAGEESSKTGHKIGFRKYSQYFDKLSLVLLVLTVFLLPFFTLFSSGSSSEVAKHLLLQSGVLLSFLCWIVARLQDGVVRIQRSLFFWSIPAVLVSALAATIFSPVVRESLLGLGVETGTFVFVFVGLLLTFLVSVHSEKPQTLSYLYGGLAVGGLVLVLTQLLHSGAGFSLGVLGSSPNANLLGKWNDFGLFFGLLAVLALSSIELFKVNLLAKRVLIAVVILSAIVLLFVNFVLAWILVAVFSLLVLVYKFSLRVRSGAHGSLMPDAATFRSASFTLLVVALVAIALNTSVNTYIVNKLNLGSLEVRPSWSSTMEIAGQSLSANPFIGSGLNRFARVWQLHKPEGVNSTIFWNADFNAGVGLIPTYAVTSGALGIIAWLFFLLGFLYIGLRSLFRTHSDHFEQCLRFISFSGALYLWLVAFFYTPDSVLFALAFIFTGIFIGVYFRANTEESESVELTSKPTLSFVGILVFIALLVVDLGFGYFLTRQSLSLISFENAVYAFGQTGNADEAGKAIARSIALHGSQDTYYRSQVDVSLIQINKLLNDNSSSVSKDVLRAQFQMLLSQAITNATKATELNSINYQNWIYLGRVYESVVPLQIQGAYDLAIQSYNKALTLYPSSPQIRLNLARLEIAKNDRAKAREYIAKALEQKNNYTEALFLLSQLDYADGNLKSAIKNAEQVALLAPQDIGVFFQLGFLKYLSRDYAGSISALERARALNANYSNAKYFLGLSYSMSSQPGKAIKEFQEIQALNPDNAEVKTILANLRSGNPPLAGIGAPANTPEKRPNLPVKEDNKSSDR